MLEALLNDLGSAPEVAVFGGMDRITRGEFSQLVWTYAGGLRKRQARNIGLVGRPGPTTLAFLLAALGTGTRVDLIDPTAGTEIVRARLEAAAIDLVIAESNMRFALKGPKWLRGPLGLPHYSVWPEILGIDDLGAAQQRRFGVERDQAAVLIFTGGTPETPSGVVHTAGSLGYGINQIMDCCAGSETGPALVEGYLEMLVAFSLGKEIIQPARSVRRLARQITNRKPSITQLTASTWAALLAAGAKPNTVALTRHWPGFEGILAELNRAGTAQTLGVFGDPSTGPVSVLSGDPNEGRGTVGEIFSRVSLRVSKKNELVVGGPGIAAKRLSGEWVEEAHTGHLVEGSGSLMKIVAADSSIIFGRKLIYPSLYEPLLYAQSDRQVALVGIPADGYRTELVALTQGPADPKLSRRMMSCGKQLGLKLAEVRFGEIPTLADGSPDRRAIVRKLAERRN